MDEKELEQAMAETVEKSFDDNELQDIMSEIESLEKEFVEDSAEPAAAASTDDLSLDKARDNDLQKAIDAEVEQMGADIDASETSEEIVADATDTLADIESEVDSFKEETAAIGEDVTEGVAAIDAAMDEEIADIEAEVTNFKEETAELAEVAAELDAAEQMTEVETVAETEVVEDNVVAFEPKPTPVATSTSAEGSQMDFNASGNMNLNLNFTIGGQTAQLVVNQENGLSVTMNGVELHINEDSGCSVELPGGVKFSIPLTDTASDSKKNAA